MPVRRRSADATTEETREMDASYIEYLARIIQTSVNRAPEPEIARVLNRELIPDTVARLRRIAQRLRER